MIASELHCNCVQKRVQIHHDRVSLGYERWKLFGKLIETVALVMNRQSLQWFYFESHFVNDAQQPIA